MLDIRTEEGERVWRRGEPEDPAAGELKDIAVQVIRQGEIAPGDILVLTCPDRLPSAALDRLPQQLERALTGVRVVILDGGMSVDSVLHWKIRGG